MASRSRTTSSYTPNRSRDEVMRDATDAGLIAAANIVVRDVQKRFRNAKGYTSGDFAHAKGKSPIIPTITRSEPHEHEGKRRILIGTNRRSEKTLAPFPLFWEMGHFNIYTRKFERVERFRPALVEKAEHAQRAFSRTVKRFLKLGGVDVDGE